jgi:hypothetical protein
MDKIKIHLIKLKVQSKEARDGKINRYQIGLPYNIRHKIWTGCEKQGRHHKPVLISSSGFKEEIIS